MRLKLKKDTIKRLTKNIEFFEVLATNSSQCGACSCEQHCEQGKKERSA